MVTLSLFSNYKEISSKKYTFLNYENFIEVLFIKSEMQINRRPISTADYYRQHEVIQMEARIYGYARVSSKEQNADRQLEALRNYGVPDENIFTDKSSGKDTERESFQALRNVILRSGDTLVVKELDRLSRNKADIRQELEYFSSKGIRVKILDIPTTLTDFPDEQTWVLGMVNNILIEVLGSIAEAERTKIRQRQLEGIEQAHKKNVKFGRPRAKKPDVWNDVMEKVRSGEMKAVDAMKIMGIKRGTYYTLIKRESEGKL